MKRLIVGLAMVACIFIGMRPFAFSQEQVIMPMDITIDGILEFTYWIGEVPVDEYDPYVPITVETNTLNFGDIERVEPYQWYGPEVYFIVFIVPSTGLEPYVLTQSFGGFTTETSNIDLSQSVIVTPQYNTNDRWEWFSNDGGGAQGNMPAADTLGSEHTRNAVTLPHSGTQCYSGRWKTAGHPNAEILYNGNSGVSRIIRCVYRIFNADTDLYQMHGVWPDGISEPDNGLITPDKLSGVMSTGESINGSVTFTLTLQGPE